MAVYKDTHGRSKPSGATRMFDKVNVSVGLMMV
jgi:hypothetical protein